MVGKRDFAALCAKRDKLVDAWLKHQEDRDAARRELAEFLINGTGAELLPPKLVEAQKAVLEAL